MARNPPDLKEREAQEFLRRRGYRVEKPGNYPKAAFYVHEDTLRQLKSISERLNCELKQCVTEALDDWCAARLAELDRKDPPVR